MSLFGTLFQAVDNSGSTPLDLSSSPPDRQVAARMAELITNESQFSGVTAAQVIDPKRAVKSMTEGEVLVDMIGVGMKSVAQNRRNYQREYVTHAAVRSKLNQANITETKMDELGAIATAVQQFFENQKSIYLDENTRATLVKAEPFVHASREHLFGDGVFLSPIEFTWKLHRT